MRTYNLFRRKRRAELVCAVPEDRPVPAFITGALWEFGGKLEDADRDPLAFNHEAAGASVRVNGFYLFQMIKPLAVSFPHPATIGKPRHAHRSEGARASDTAGSEPRVGRRPSTVANASAGGLQLRTVNRAHRPLVEAPTDLLRR
jgi:hypothetical protein